MSSSERPPQNTPELLSRLVDARPKDKLVEAELRAIRERVAQPL
jgi:hypothetical protein